MSSTGVEDLVRPVWNECIGVLDILDLYRLRPDAVATTRCAAGSWLFRPDRPTAEVAGTAIETGQLPSLSIGYRPLPGVWQKVRRLMMFLSM